MAMVYGDTGSYTKLFEKLRGAGVVRFDSIEEILEFQNNFDFITSDIINEQKKKRDTEIEKHKNTLEELTRTYIEDLKIKIPLLLNERSRAMEWLEDYEKQGLLNRLLRHLDNQKYKKFISHFNDHYCKSLGDMFSDSLEEIKEERNLADQMLNHPEAWAKAMVKKQLQEQEGIKSILDEEHALIAGAIGEEKVANELEKLPETYMVINDFSAYFASPIYNRKENDKIFSVQVDHIVIGPTGFYLIETKNWSQQSIENENLFSPVKQLSRANYALFCLMNRPRNPYVLSSLELSWGRQKVSPKKIIAMIRHKPVQEFEYVKILSLPELNRYVTFGEKVFTKEQINEMTDYLLDMSE
jgi:hypothetical protein